VQAFAPVNPVADTPDQHYVAETKHTMRATFKTYWETHGGVSLFGFPISEEFPEKGADGTMRTVQYFERARFEYHPEFQGTPYAVELGLLTDELKQGQSNTVTFHRAAPAAPGSDQQWYDATGHAISGAFQTYWDQHGGLAVFGYPLTESFDEQSATDGNTYQVQYFERERFEYHPEFKGTLYEVELGLLGRELAVQRGYLPPIG
jgi:hypothetical protein